MSAQLTDDQIRRLSQDLVHQVAYAFYDPPYIILLNLMVQLGVAREQDLADACQLTQAEVRKYLGMLLTHRLLKRYVNKEKTKVPERFIRSEEADRFRVKDIIYYYLDYREFANVTKYRVAMMRKALDEKIMQDVGHKGYVCPTCRRAYDPLSLATLFSPAQNAFLCEDDRSELIEVVPDETDGTSDKMQRFNRATQPIRDALKAVDGVTLPATNIVAWIAQNVKSEMIPGVGGEGEGEGEGGRGKGKGGVQVVLGGEGERERAERERAAEAQRVQNALPIWHTHSTVTGSATALGLKDQHASALRAGEAGRSKAAGDTAGEDEMLMQHYNEMYGDGSGEGEGEGDGDGDVGGSEVGGDASRRGVKQEEEETTPTPISMPMPAARDAVAVLNGGSVVEKPSISSGPIPADGVVMVNVNGIPKPLDDITDEDQEMMTPDEYQAYYDAALAA